MGIKTTVAGLTYNASHFPNAAKSGLDVNTLHNEILLMCTELSIKMKRMVNSMPNGDSNIATLNTQITNLN
jgi:hypothetical protein